MTTASTPAAEWWLRYFTPLYRMVYQGPLLDREGTAAEVEFLAEEFEGSQNGLLLDIGCGFGRHLRGLAKRGFRVAGLDRFHHLLAAHPKAARRLACADMRVMPFCDGAFAGAYCLFNTFGYFAHEDNRAMLRQWARVLAPEAKLVIQIPNRPAMARITRDFPPVQMLGDGITMSEAYEYDDGGKTLRGRGIWQLRDGSQQEWELAVRLYTQKEMETELKRAGLKLVATYSEYDRADFKARSSSEMILVAQRQGSTRH